jgi:ketosteroid isomerase-like protein
MSEENVEIVRRLWDAWERRDSEAALALCAPEIEVTSHTRLGTFFTRAYRGHAGVKRFFQEFIESFDDFYAHAADFTAAGPDVIAHVTYGGRGKESGATVERSHWMLYRLREGRIVSQDSYDSRDEALEAAGLSE